MLGTSVEGLEEAAAKGFLSRRQHTTYTHIQIHIKNCQHSIQFPCLTSEDNQKRNVKWVMQNGLEVDRPH